MSITLSRVHLYLEPSRRLYGVAGGCILGIYVHMF